MTKLKTGITVKFNKKAKELILPYNLANKITGWGKVWYYAYHSQIMFALRDAVMQVLSAGGYAPMYTLDCAKIRFAEYDDERNKISVDIALLTDNTQYTVSFIHGPRIHYFEIIDKKAGQVYMYGCLPRRRYKPTDTYYALKWMRKATIPEHPESVSAFPDMFKCGDPEDGFKKSMVKISVEINREKYLYDRWYNGTVHFIKI